MLELPFRFLYLCHGPYFIEEENKNLGIVNQEHYGTFAAHGICRFVNSDPNRMVQQIIQLNDPQLLSMNVLDKK